MPLILTRVWQLAMNFVKWLLYTSHAINFYSCLVTSLLKGLFLHSPCHLLMNLRNVYSGPHSQLTVNPSGAYSQLIHLQEEHQSKQQHSNDPDKLEIHLDDSNAISRAGSRRSSLRRSISSTGSSGVGGSHRSFSFPFALPAEEGLEENVQLIKPKQGFFSFISRYWSKTRGDVEDGQQNPGKGVPVLRLASLNKPEVPVLILGSIAAAVNGVTVPVFALLLSSIIGSFYEPPHKIRKDVSFWSLIIVALAAASLLATPVQMYCFAVAGGRLVRRIRSLTFNKAVYQEIGWFDHSENSRYWSNQRNLKLFQLLEETTPILLNFHFVWVDISYWRSY